MDDIIIVLNLLNSKNKFWMNFIWDFLYCNKKKENGNFFSYLGREYSIKIKC